MLFLLGARGLVFPACRPFLLWQILPFLGLVVLAQVLPACRACGVSIAVFQGLPFVNYLQAALLGGSICRAVLLQIWETSTIK